MKIYLVNTDHISCPLKENMTFSAPSYGHQLRSLVQDLNEQFGDHNNSRVSLFLDHRRPVRLRRNPFYGYDETDKLLRQFMVTPEVHFPHFDLFLALHSLTVWVDFIYKWWQYVSFGTVSNFPNPLSHLFVRIGSIRSLLMPWTSAPCGTLLFLFYSSGVLGYHRLGLCIPSSKVFFSSWSFSFHSPKEWSSQSSRVSEYQTEIYWLGKCYDS